MGSTQFGIALLMRSIKDFASMRPDAIDCADLLASITRFKDFVDKNPNFLYEGSDNVNDLLVGRFDASSRKLRIDTAINTSRINEV